MPELSSDKKRKRHEVNPEQIRSTIKSESSFCPGFPREKLNTIKLGLFITLLVKHEMIYHVL